MEKEEALAELKSYYRKRGGGFVMMQTEAQIKLIKAEDAIADAKRALAKLK